LSARDSRVLRGGAFYLDAELVRCAFREFGDLDPDFRDYLFGFRVVVSPFFSER
jgi:formylglycine-generating enzyme required for sulfatase activity